MVRLASAAFGLAKYANLVAVGKISRRISSRFAVREREIPAMPVTLPPGRLKLATSPSLTGSAPPEKTIGMAEVADFDATAASKPPAATITATLRLTSSAANRG